MKLPADRQTMEHDLAEHLAGRGGYDLLPGSAQANLKSYVVEAHPAKTITDAREELRRSAERVGATVRATEDATLFIMVMGVLFDGRTADVGFWVDLANPRFWLLHSKTNAGPTSHALRRLVGHTATLDTAWLPRNQLRSVQHHFKPFGFRLGFDERPFYGREVDMLELQEPTHRLNVEHAGVGAEAVYRLLEESDITRRAMAVAEVGFWDHGGSGTQLMRLNRSGRLRSSGPSLESHLQGSRALVRSYETFIRNVEHAFTLRAGSNTDDRPLLEGRPLSIRAHKPASFEFASLVHRLVSGVEPFRLLGSVQWPEPDLAWIEAIDLHTGAPLRIDMTPDWLRAYLGHGLCGNSLARLVTNLQRAYDASLDYFDDESRSVFAVAG